MTTETIEAESDDSLVCPEEYETATDTFDPAGYDPNDCAGCGRPKSEHLPATIPMEPHSVEVEGDVVASVADEHDHEIARAEWEGLNGKPLPVPAPRTPMQQIEDAERDERIEQATAEVCSYQEISDRKKSAYLVAKEEASDAKKAAEAADDDYRDAGRRLRKLREGRFPDGDKFPLFDGPTSDPRKAGINASFAAPEAIPPTPPETFEEALRRKQRDTTVDQLDLDNRTLKVLDDLGIETVGDVVRKWNEVLGSGAKLASMKGVTSARQESIATALAEFTEACQAEWDASHPADPGPESGPDEDAEIDSMIDDTAAEDAIGPDDDE